MSNENAMKFEQPQGLALVMQAALFAATMHRGQRRKGEPREDDVFQDKKRTPYINHPLEVASRIASAVPDAEPEVIAAALLHDVVEDCGVSSAALAEKFGGEVAEIVAWVSELPKKGNTFEMRKADMLARAPKFNRGAKLVKVADMLTNLTELFRNVPKEWNLEKQQSQFDRARAMFECIRGESKVLDAEFVRLMERRPTVDLRKSVDGLRGSE